MRPSTLGLASIAVLSIASALTLPHENQHPLVSNDAFHAGYSSHAVPEPLCPLSRPIDPSLDGLMSSEKLFSGTKALKTMVERHQPLVRIESICYDDLGDFDDDDRWKPFYEIPVVLEKTYPNM